MAVKTPDSATVKSRAIRLRDRSLPHNWITQLRKSMRTASGHPIAWMWLLVTLLASLCAKSVLIAAFGTMGLVPSQDAALVDHSSDSYRTHYTENTITTDFYKFVLADGKYVDVTTSLLLHSLTIEGDAIKLGLLGDSVVSIS